MGDYTFMKKAQACKPSDSGFSPLWLSCSASLPLILVGADSLF